MLGSHNGHKYKDISNSLYQKKREIENETREIEITIIPLYKRNYEETKRKLQTTLTKFCEMEKEEEKHRKYWHQEVDTIFDKVGSLMKSMKEYHMAALKLHQFLQEQVECLQHRLLTKAKVGSARWH